MATKQISILRRVLNWIGLAVALFILAVVLIGFWTLRTESNYRATAVPYLLTVLPEFTKWDPMVVWKLYSPEIRETISLEQNERVVRSIARLGELIRLGTPKFVQVTASATVRTGTKKLILYEVPAIFENGKASISVRIKDDDGSFSIYSIKFNSDVFLD